MNTKLKFLRIFLFLVTIEVITVELCQKTEYNATDLESFKRKRFVLDTDRVFYKCVPNKTCANYCVPSGYRLEVVSYLDETTEKGVNMYLYSVTGCKCSERKPINQINKSPESQEKHYLKMYKMMRNSTITLAAVCIVFSLIIVFLCIRYEPFCRKCKRHQKKKNNNSTVLSKQAEPRASLIQEEEPAEA